MTVLYFIIALGVLIIVHEWGHFIVARKSGIRVDEFAIGFGPKLFSYKPGPTEYKVCLFPLGGYVKMYGEDPDAESEGDQERAEQIAKSPDSFGGKSVKARLATVFAGPFMNLVLCLLIMPVVFMIGKKYPAFVDEAPIVMGVMADSPAAKAGINKGDRLLTFNGEALKTWEDTLQRVLLHPEMEAVIEVERDGSKQQVNLKIENQSEKVAMGFAGFEPALFIGNDPIIKDVSEDSPAARAGLMPGDVITAINGQEISSWSAMTKLVQDSGGKPLQVGVARGAEKIEVTVTPTFDEGMGAYLMGISRELTDMPMVVKRYGFFSAIQRGTQENWNLFTLTGQILVRLITGDLSFKALGGPVQIFSATGAAARSGIADFLYFMAFLSMQLGVLNLLPIPVLDGGHVLFMGIEGIRGKPIPHKVRVFFIYMGLTFLLGLMLAVTYNDIDRMWDISSWIDKLGNLF